jgi:hypothetical protein
VIAATIDGGVSTSAPAGIPPPAGIPALAGSGAP